MEEYERDCAAIEDGDAALSDVHRKLEWEVADTEPGKLVGLRTFLRAAGGETAAAFQVASDVTGIPLMGGIDGLSPPRLRLLEARSKWSEST